MPGMKALLTQLSIGSSVAEFDDALDRYFIETEAFRGLAGDQADIIAGDKGTGKTALYRVFAKRYTSIPALKQMEVVPGFNPVGNPVFQRLAHVEALSEGQYVTVWKSYFLSLAGNWLLQFYGASSNGNMRGRSGRLAARLSFWLWKLLSLDSFLVRRCSKPFVATMFGHG